MIDTVQIISIVKSCSLAALAAVCCVWLLRPLATRLGLVDHPGGRKQHRAAVPLIGGLIMLFGFLLGVLSLHQSLQHYRSLIAALGILLLVGVVDDFKGLTPRLRLFGQLLAAVFLVSWGHVLLENLGSLFALGSLELKLWAFPVTVLVVMAYINAMNMVDGQDGLAGGIALGQVILLLLLSVQLNLIANIQLLSILAVMLMVFLAFNLRLFGRKQASIFIGDAGAVKHGCI